MAELQKYKDIASALIERDRELKGKIFPEMDRMGDNEWIMPAPVAKMKWLIPRIDSSPRNAEIAGVRSFSTMLPSPSIVRPGSEPADKVRYNRVENALRYQYMLASSRPSSDLWMFGATPTEKMLRSAIRYGEIAAQVVHVDAHLKLMGETKESRKRAIRQHGDYIISVYDPKSVHVRTSPFGIEGGLLKKVQTLAEFSAYWGDKAKAIVRKAKDANADETYVVSYDYTDFDVRAVWASVSPHRPSGYDTFSRHVDGAQIMLEEHNLPFMPWVWRGGVEPLNYAVYVTGAWHAANVAETLAYSEQVHYAAYPRFQKKGPKPDSIIIDYTQPGNPVNVPAQHELLDMKPPVINEGHVIMGDRTRGDIRAMTVPSVVTSLASEANEAYATFDQRLKSGLTAYTPAQEVAERALEDVFCQMLYWPKYLETPLKAPYLMREGGKEVFSYGENGEAFVLDPKTYEYDLKVSVVLSPNDTIDEMQKITAATNMVQYLGYDRVTAREKLGETDSESVDNRKMQEVLNDSELQGELMKIQAQKEVEARAISAGVGNLLPFLEDPNFAQTAVQVLQQMAQQAMQPQQQQQAAPAGQEPLPNPETPQGLSGVSGSGFDASQGGSPAAMANPVGNALSNV